MHALLIILLVLLGLQVLGFLIYWFNLDMKFVYQFQKVLNKKYDNLERDRKL